MTWHILDVTKFWRYDVCYTYWCHSKRLTSWNFMTTWYTFWRLDALFDVMSNFMTSWCVVTFCRHDVFLTPWQAFCLVDIFVFIISGTNIMKTCFWYYNTLLDVMICFHVMMNFLTSRRVFTFMTNCLTLWRIFDFLTSWHMFYFMTNLWRHDKPSDVMVCFDAMTNLMASWQTWWRHDKLCGVITFFLHFMINFVTSWRRFYIMSKLFEVMTNFFK